MWKDYIDCMMGFKDAKHAGVIFLETGEVIASSPNFHIKEKEILEIFAGFKALEEVKTLGIKVDGCKYHVLKADKTIICGTKLSPSYVACVKTYKVLLILQVESDIGNALKFRAVSHKDFIKPDKQDDEELFAVKSEGSLDKILKYKILHDKAESIFEPRPSNLASDFTIPHFVEEMEQLGQHLMYYNS